MTDMPLVYGSLPLNRLGIIFHRMEPAVLPDDLSPAMIAAGVWVIAEKHGLIGEGPASEVAEEVYRAMRTAKITGVFSAPDEADSFPR